MALPTDTLELAIFLHEALEDLTIHQRCVSGRLPDSVNFSEAVAALNNNALLVSDDSASSRIEFRLPHSPNNEFYSTLDELLENTTRRINPPTRFYIAELKQLFGNQSATHPILQAYIDAALFFRLLQSLADHSNHLDQSLVFWEKGKVVLTPDFTSLDLANPIHLGELKSEFFESNVHSKQKHTIIRMALFEEFAGQSSIKFSQLLNKFKSFQERISASYQLYVSEFSFDKVKSEIEKEKLEFTTKLNKVFSDIQNQLLAIPVALILIGAQMENASSWTLKNTFIWIGALFFCVLMNLLIRNQRNTLDAIHHEMQQQWLQIKGKHHSVADRFKDSYTTLEVRYQHQENLIRAVSGMVALALAIATGLFIYYSVPIIFFLQSILWSSIVLIVGFVYFLVRWFRSKKASISAGQTTIR